MKIALVHDHLAQDGGAEDVVRAFCEIWPEAPVYVVVHDPAMTLRMRIHFLTPKIFEPRSFNDFRLE
jgi:hypothetical protein